MIERASLSENNFHARSLNFAPGCVAHHHIMGAILLYLTIAITFVALFTFIGSLVPKAFSGLSLDDSPALASNLIYFSFVTLTTTGYGDIFPGSR
jgi:hypothetical protein